MALWELLRTLADDELPRRERDAAAAALYAMVQRFGGGTLRRRFPHLPQVIVEEAIHKVVLEASLGRSRFRGEDDRAARAWCNRILQRYAIDYFRSRKNKVNLDDAPAVKAPADDDPVFAADLEHLFGMLLGSLSRLHRARDLERVQDNVRIHLEAHLLGEEIEPQIARWADPGGEASATDRRRARDRVYQYRRRGKVAACAAIAALHETGEIGVVEVDLMTRLLGCDEASEEAPAGRREGDS
ncbi:MAG: hypothetical protein P1V51_02275 [Deltaproteobacteria bacterium]|nr:hypothetical protein [Deltaproteobacteria bacterium]